MVRWPIISGRMPAMTSRAAQFGQTSTPHSFGPSFSYTTSTAVTYGLNLEASANWEAIDDDEWTVPMHLTVSKLTKFGAADEHRRRNGSFTAAPGDRIGVGVRRRHESRRIATRMAATNDSRSSRRCSRTSRTLDSVRASSRRGPGRSRGLGAARYRRRTGSRFEELVTPGDLEPQPPGAIAIQHDRPIAQHPMHQVR